MRLCLEKEAIELEPNKEPRLYLKKSRKKKKTALHTKERLQRMLQNSLASQ